MAILALVVGLIALVLAVATFATVLLLLGGKADRFVTWRQMDVLIARMTKVEKGNSALYLYLEGVDEATGGDGYKVLAGRMPQHDTSA